jgi:tricorn protease-like protein
MLSRYTNRATLLATNLSTRKLGVPKACREDEMTKKKIVFAIAGIAVILAIAMTVFQLLPPTTIEPSTTPPASPLQASPITIQGLRGGLLFHSNREGNYDIYALDLETGKAKRLTDSPANEVEPALSPDGTHIAFARARLNPRGQDIYVMNTDGTNPKRITFMDESIAMCPDWSPDGSQIIFYATRESHFHLFVVSAEGGEISELAGGPTNDMMPTWSPDGTKIAFSSDRDGRSELYVMNADGSNPQRLTDSLGNDWRPRWHPDGKSIVFQSDETGNWEIYRINTETMESKQLTSDGVDSEMPSWNRDGSLVYYTRKAGVDYNLYLLDPINNTVQQLTQAPGSNDRYPMPLDG